MRRDFGGDLQLMEWNSLDEPARNASQATLVSNGNSAVGTTIEYGYDSNVQYDYVVVGSGAGYDQSESNQLNHNINVSIKSVEDRLHLVLPLLAIKFSSSRLGVMPATISHRRYLR